MSRQSTSYGWLGWAVAAIILMFFIFSPRDKNKESNTISDTTPTSSYSQPAAEDTNTALVQSADAEPAAPSNSWHCVDATSYNQNAYDDNKCTNGSETKYVSDSQAVSLDPNYSPGKAGAAYYNNQ